MAGLGLKGLNGKYFLIGPSVFFRSKVRFYAFLVLYINPIDTNPAVAACAVFPQSGSISPTAVFPYFSTFFQRGTPKKVYIGVQYIELKAVKCSSIYQSNNFVLINRYS